MESERYDSEAINLRCRKFLLLQNPKPVIDTVYLGLSEPRSVGLLLDVSDKVMASMARDALLRSKEQLLNENRVVRILA